MSNRFARICGAALVVAALAGCTKKALQGPDAGGAGVLPTGTGGGGGGPGDAAAGAAGGGVTDAGGGAFDAGWDVAFSGRQSFVVTAQVGTDRGAAPSHTFTMVLDSNQRIAITGASGGGDVTPVEQTGANTFHFGRSFTFGVYVPGSCGASVRCDDLTFSIDGSGALSGSGRGVLMTFSPLAQSTGATIALSGVPDTDPPSFSLAAGGDLSDPWTSLWVVASEPLPSGQAVPILRSASGDALPFAPDGSDDKFVAVLERPPRLLRFGEQYRVTYDGITDFAGHAPTAAASNAFTTRAAPPLIANDGFESVTDLTLGGAQILSGAGTPTIGGARSLYLPPVESLGTGATVTQFALRVPIGAGDTLAFSYRIVNLASAAGDTSNVSYLIASVGGPIQSVSLTDVGAPTTPVTIGATAVVLGPLQTARIPLVPGSSGEVVLARTAAQPTSCLGPAPLPVSGIVIDDLRVE